MPVSFCGCAPQIKKIFHLENSVKIYFNKINADNIKEIMFNKINLLKKKYLNLGISVKIDKSIMDSLINLTEYDLYGARKVDKVLEEKIESVILDEVFNGNNNIVISEPSYIN